MQQNSASRHCLPAETGRGERYVYFIWELVWALTFIWSLALVFLQSSCVQAKDSFSVVTVKYKPMFAAYRKVLLVNVISKGIKLQ